MSDSIPSPRVAVAAAVEHVIRVTIILALALVVVPPVCCSHRSSAARPQPTHPLGELNKVENLVFLLKLPVVLRAGHGQGSEGAALAFRKAGHIQSPLILTCPNLLQPFTGDLRHEPMHGHAALCQQSKHQTDLPPHVPGADPTPPAGALECELVGIKLRAQPDGLPLVSIQVLCETLPGKGALSPRQLRELQTASTLCEGRA
mmetsp:Transcript_2561/g.7095  ORF Transcript_2561/g.7095 Transcript_2561/m.7095 type:complete len:203 (+) Transcript_2561:148-756(+)